MKQKSIGLVTIIGIAVFLFGAFPALAQVAPPAGVWQQFGALGNSGVTGSTGTGTVVSGDVGSSPTPSISNFPPSTVAIPFTLHLANDLTVQAARTSAIAAYNFLAAQGPGTVLPAQLDGASPFPGVYSFAGGAADLAALGTLTLNGGPADIFIFEVDSALTFNVGSNVIGTADPCNVYWRVGTSATLNGISFRGTVIADASITVGSGSNVTGRVLAGTGTTGAVTMAGSGGNTIGGCSAVFAPCPTITVNPPTLPNPVVGTPYNETVTATGGVGPYTFAVTSGALPAGLVLSSAGAITGTPTTAGNSSFTITATDTSSGCTGTRDYGMFTNGAAGVPALDSAGLAMLMALLAGVGLFVMRRFSV